MIVREKGTYQELKGEVGSKPDADKKVSRLFMSL